MSIIDYKKRIKINYNLRNLFYFIIFFCEHERQASVMQW